MSEAEKGESNSQLSGEFSGAAEGKPAREFRSVRVTKRAGNNDMVAGRPFEEFKDFAECHSYERRESQGFGYQCNPFGFVLAVYREWMVWGVESGNPLTQADIKAADPRLYWQLFNKSQKAGGIPNWLYLPEDASAPVISKEELQERISERPDDLKMFKKPRIRTERDIAELDRIRGLYQNLPRPSQE